MPRLSQRRREPVRQAAFSRCCHRRRLRQPCAGAGRQVPAGLRSAAGQSGGNLDVFRRDRLWRAKAPGRPAAGESALKNGADVAYDPSEADVVKRIVKETEGGFDAIVDFAGNEKSMAFAVGAVARGGKIVVSGLMGGDFSLPMVQWIYKRMTIEGFMVGTLAEGHELMALARAGKIKPTPMKEEPMGDVQKWIDELRAGKVVGRIVLKN